MAKFVISHSFSFVNFAKKQIDSVICGTKPRFTGLLF